MTTPPLLIVALAATLTGAPQAAPSRSMAPGQTPVVATSGPLAGCSTIRATSTIVGLQCPRGHVMWADEGERQFEQGLEQFARSTAERSHLTLRTEPPSPILVRAATRAARYALGDAIRIDADLVEHAGLPSRSYACVAASLPETDCERWLLELMRSGLPEPFASLVRRPTRADVAGRPLPIPPGCELSDSTRTSGRVHCDATQLVWTDGEAGAMQQAEAKLAKFLESRLAEGAWEQGRACWLEGVKTVCRRRVGRVKGEPFAAWLTSAEVRGTHLVAWCLQSPGELLAPLCAEVLKLAPAAP
jgi:hypothetical protein